MIKGRSIWEDETYYNQQDFIIIGAGLVGLWCALELKLKYPAAKITILEKGMIPIGASTRNAGFACFGSPTEMIADKPIMGEDKLWQTVAMRFKGIEKIRRTLGDNNIDFDLCGGYECLHKEQAEKVNDHLSWLNYGMKAITGLPNSFQWADNKLDGFGFKGFDNLIENRLEGGLHSGKLVQALVSRVTASGITILTGVEVDQVKEDNRNQIVNTINGTGFKTRYVLYCTNAFTNLLVKDACITPARGQIVVTEPIEGLKMKGTFHYDEGFYYFRNVGDRILIGGARNQSFNEEETIQFETTGIIQNELKRFITTHLLPENRFTISHSWSGIMGFTDNKEPLIKIVNEQSMAVIACNGMGVALSPIIAEEVAKMF